MIAENIIRTNNLSISYIESGTGSNVVICLPGWPFGKSMYLKLLEEKKPRNLRIIAIDYPGWGKSESISGEVNYFTISKFVINLISILKLEKVNLLGVSFGAAVALSIASLYPKKIKSVVASAPPIYFEKYVNTLQKVTFEICDHLPIVKDVYFKQLISGKRWAWSLIFGNFPDTKSDNLAYKVFEELRCVKKKAMDETLHQIMNTDLRNEITKIALPVLLLTGDKDYMFKDTKYANIKIPHSKLEIIKNGDHVMVVKRSKEFNSRVIKFFSSA